MKAYNFYKNESGWFIDLPNFPFDKSLLAMVCGADDLLDKLSKGRDEVKIAISSNYNDVDYDDVLKLEAKLGLRKGAIYKTLLNKLQDNGFGKDRLWLCPVTLWVFLRYPKNIYFKVLN